MPNPTCRSAVSLAALLTVLLTPWSTACASDAHVEREAVESFFRNYIQELADGSPNSLDSAVARYSDKFKFLGDDFVIDSREELRKLLEAPVPERTLHELELTSVDIVLSDPQTVVVIVVALNRDLRRHIAEDIQFEMMLILDRPTPDTFTIRRQQVNTLLIHGQREAIGDLAPPP